jgi:hypothetical protein
MRLKKSVLLKILSSAIRLKSTFYTSAGYTFSP